MHCPKCGGEIAFYDLHPNCKHCGVNIMYYTQESGLVRDAKRAELESASARMVVARIKANFIGGKLQIARMILSILSAAALLVPFGGVRFRVPFYEGAFSAGLLGMISAFRDGSAMHVPDFMGSTLFAQAMPAALVSAAFLAVIAVLDLLIFAAFLLGFLNLTGSAKFIRSMSLVGAGVSAAAQIASVLLKVTAADSDMAQVTIGFGALVSMAVFLALFFLSRALLRRGIEPTYRENDLKRRALLRQVRAGEVDLDSLPLPIFESAEEHAERIRALEEALKAEEEGKEV